MGGGSNYGVYGCLLSNHFPSNYVDLLNVDSLYCNVVLNSIKKQEVYCERCIFHADSNNVVLSRWELGYLIKLISKGGENRKL